MFREVGDADGSLQDEVAAAEPSIDEKTSKLVSRGRWGVPGYKVLRPFCNAPRSIFANVGYRKNSAISPCYRKQHGWHLPFVYTSIVDIGVGRGGRSDMGGGMLKNTRHSSRFTHLFANTETVCSCSQSQWLRILGLTCQQVSYCFDPIPPPKASAS